MSKIRPKDGWNRYTEPPMPTKPSEPMKTLRTARREEHSRFRVHEKSPVPLSALPIPDGEDFDSIVIELEVEKDWDGDSDYYLVFYCETWEETPNPVYDTEAKIYRRQLDEWQEKCEAHKAEVATWAAWVEQEKATELQLKLNQAEALLKAHGRKVITPEESRKSR